uniref:WD_REPEATS_REGION domain-containing protein n=1 Tax=Glossina pallidipes TaxID=7398 RepID=A0A1B0A697_GLOPL
MNSERNADPYVEGYFVGHTKPVIQVCFGPDGSSIATSSADSTVVLWDLKSAIRCLRFSEHAKRVNGISWSPKSNFMASCSQDGFVNIWKPKAHCISHEFLFHDKHLRSIDFHPTGPSILVRSAKFSPNGDENFLRIFDMKSSECVWSLTEEKGLGRQLTWNPNGNIVAVALSCCRVKVCDLVAQEPVQLYQCPVSPQKASVRSLNSNSVRANIAINDHLEQAFLSAVENNIELFAENEANQLAFDIFNNFKMYSTKQEHCLLLYSMRMLLLLRDGGTCGMNR